MSPVTKHTAYRRQKGGEVLLFGSEEMKEILIDLMQNPHHYARSAMIIQDCVIMHTTKRLVSGFAPGEIKAGSKGLSTAILSKEDGEEVINDVLRIVLTSLDSFTISIVENDYNELQRQAWLRSIIFRVIVKHMRARINEIAVENRVVRHVDSYTEDRMPSMFEATVRDMLITACTAPSKPEKIMAYIFNDLIFREITARKKNADSSITCDYMNGKTL